MSSDLNATVTMRYEINHGLLVLQVVPDEEMPAFSAGQYTVLGLPGSAIRTTLAEPEDAPADPEKIIKRAYSITSSSRQGKYFEFYVALVRTGALTPRLFALQAGDRIWMSRRVVGMFTLDDVPEGNDVVFVATGTGLAPYLSMLRSAYQFDAARRTVVCQAARVSWDLGYRSELEDSRRVTTTSTTCDHRRERPRPPLERRGRLRQPLLRRGHGLGVAGPGSRTRAYVGLPLRKPLDDREHGGAARRARLQGAQAPGSRQYLHREILGPEIAPAHRSEFSSRSLSARELVTGMLRKRCSSNISASRDFRSAWSSA